MTDADIARMIDEALEAVVAAGTIAGRYFRTAMVVDNKLGGGFFDPVTQADREIEQMLRERLDRNSPGIRIIGEEFGTTGEGADYWIIDPIDGTRAFMSGMPTWGILLGLVVDGRAVGGIMHQPFTGETFIGDPVRGARLLHQGTETRLATSIRRELRDAVIYSTDPKIMELGGLAGPYARLGASCRLQRWGGDCYAFALVALGSIDLMVEVLLAPYDIVPMIAIIEQAGGVVTDMDGHTPLSGGTVIAAANAELHAAALAMLRGLAN
jgi:myo-inositol-1(or 4)-monophosphatase